MRFWILALLMVGCTAPPLDSQAGFISEVVDGESLEVRINGKNQMVKLCGITPKNGAQAELKKLVKPNDAIAIVGQGDSVEIFLPTNSGEEIHLNGELLLRGVAIIDESEINRCPNGEAMKGA